MGVDVRTIYMEDGIRGTAISVWVNTNACAWYDDPDCTCSNFERLIKSEFYYDMKETTFWNVKVTEGMDFVAVVVPDQYIAINTKTFNTVCSNMNKNMRRKWRRRIIELIKQSKL